MDFTLISLPPKCQHKLINSEELSRLEYAYILRPALVTRDLFIFNESEDEETCT